MSVFLQVSSLTELIKMLPDEKTTIECLMGCGLLKASVDCSKCGKEMVLRVRKDSYEWRCRNGKKDCSSQSVRKGSFFENSRITLLNGVKLLFLWLKKFSAKQISAETGVSEQTVCDWRNFFREICIRIETGYGPIGGQGNIVEIDETNLHCRKYGIGKSSGDDWILGGIDRTTGSVFAMKVQNRTASTLVPLLQQKIRKDSIVYSDEWRSYSKLKNYFQGHFTVQHKTQFVNMIGTRAVCTNGIEAVWSRLKKPFKNGNGTSSALVDSYISEFVVRENEGDGFVQRFVDEMMMHVK